MTQDEVESAIQKLKGLFPMTTVEQIRFWADRFADRDFRHVDRAIERFAEKHGDFVDRPGLLELMNAEVRRDAGDNIARIAAEKAAADAHWAEIDAVIAGITDQDLVDLKDAALKTSRKLTDDAKAMLAKFNPRTCRTLRGLIFKFLNMKAA